VSGSAEIVDSNPAQSIKYVDSNTATPYFLYEKTSAVNPLILNRNYDDEEEEQAFISADITLLLSSLFSSLPYFVAIVCCRLVSASS
jgi:hypothetical protein